MTDIIKIALERRARLHEEAMELDAFLRSAESLLRNVEREATTTYVAPRQEAPRPVETPHAEEVPQVLEEDEAGAELERRGIIRRRA